MRQGLIKAPAFSLPWGGGFQGGLPMAPPPPGMPMMPGMPAAPQQESLGRHEPQAGREEGAQVAQQMHALQQAQAAQQMQALQQAQVGPGAGQAPLRPEARPFPLDTYSTRGAGGLYSTRP